MSEKVNKIRKNTVNSFGFLIIGIILLFVLVISFFTENLHIWKEKDISYVDNAEWALLSTTWILKMQQATDDGIMLRDRTYFNLGNDYMNNLDQVANDLDHLFDLNNPIRTALLSATNGYLFDNIVSFNTDPFSIYGIIFVEDESGDCAGFGDFRSFTDEYGMHANPDLAEKQAFYRIQTGDIDNYGRGAINKPIFFQFDDHPDGIKIKKDYGPDYVDHKDKRAWILETYDLAGLKKSFYETKDWRKVFLAFEFVTPTYLFHKTDLAGRPYVMEGLRTDIKRLSIQTTFNFKEVVDNMPELRSELTRFEERRKEIEQWYQITMLTLYFVLIAIGLIGVFALLYVEKVTRTAYVRI